MTEAPAPPPRWRPGWVRRNLAALTVIAVALPAGAGLLLGLPLADRAGREPAVIDVDGSVATASGHSFTLVDSGEFVGTGRDGPDANRIPVGLSLVAALVEIEPIDGQATGAACTPALLRDGDDGREERWRPVIDAAQYGYGYGATTTPYCSLTDAGGAGSSTVELVFLTPTGAAEGASIEIAVAPLDGATGGTSLRFPLGSAS